MIRAIGIINGVLEMIGMGPKMINMVIKVANRVPGTVLEATNLVLEAILKGKAIRAIFMPL